MIQISSLLGAGDDVSLRQVAYQYGVAGAFFYAACNSTQIMVFSNLAIQTKRVAPNARWVFQARQAGSTLANYSHLPCRTFLEIMRVRYGTFVHLSFMFFSLAANTVSCAVKRLWRLSAPPRSITDGSMVMLQLVVSSILLGGAAAINSLTGMSIYAATWLLPLSVAAYTLRGGLRFVAISSRRVLTLTNRADLRSLFPCPSIRSLAGSHQGYATHRLHSHGRQ